MTYLPAALDLAAHGFAVFGLNPGGKPWPNCGPCEESCLSAEDYDVCECLFCHGTYAGTTDPSRLKEMWIACPNSIIGLRTGAASGVFVLDFDTHSKEKDGAAAYVKLRDEGFLPRTVSARTGGGGLHLYYRHPGPTIKIMNDNRGKIAPGCDVKGDNGYVIAPPSIKQWKQRGYTWYPDHGPGEIAIADPHRTILLPVMVDLLAPRPPAAPSILEIDFSELTATRLQEALQRLDWAGVGSRNDLLYRAACRAGEAVAAGTLTMGDAQAHLAEAGTAAGLRHKEVRDTVRSGLNRGSRDFQMEVQ